MHCGEDGLKASHLGLKHLDSRQAARICLKLFDFNCLCANRVVGRQAGRELLIREKRALQEQTNSIGSERLALQYLVACA